MSLNRLKGELKTKARIQSPRLLCSAPLLLSLPSNNKASFCLNLFLQQHQEALDSLQYLTLTDCTNIPHYSFSAHYQDDSSVPFKVLGVRKCQALQEACRYWQQQEPYGTYWQQYCQLPCLSGMHYNQVFVHLTPSGCRSIKIPTGSLKLQPWAHPSYWLQLARA